MLMLHFLTLSIGCQIAFLALYKLAFQSEKMCRFNRFYLISGLLLSVVLPFMSFEIVTRTEIIESVVMSDIPVTSNDVTEVTVESPNYAKTAFWIVYAVVTLMLATRFLRNLQTLVAGIVKNQKVKSGNSTLVLLDSPVAPYSFFAYIFLPKSAFENGQIAPEIITHEKTHVRQWHSIDVLLVEFFQILFWFNPLLPAYKKAIRLNHEFLADEKVLQTHSSAQAYQNLLLSYASFKAPLVASSLNFSLTKRRLEMMNITPSNRRILIKKLSACVAIPFAFLLISVQTVAQQIVQNSPQDPGEYYAQTRFKLRDESGKVTVKNYRELSDSDKAFLAPLAHPSKAVPPGENEIIAWQDQKQFAIWIDDRVQPNAVLKSRKASEFASFFSSFVHKNARSAKFPQPYQVHLYTPAFYNSFVKNTKAPAEITLSMYGSKKDLQSRKAKSDANAKKEQYAAEVTYNFGENTGQTAEEKKSDGQQPKTQTTAVNQAESKPIRDTTSDKTNVDQKPEYPGGMAKFYEYIASKFVYPKPANGAYVSGRVVASFTISETGSVTEVKILKGMGPEIDEQIVSILNNSANWKPAIIDGKAVSYSLQLPVSVEPK